MIFKDGSYYLGEFHNGVPEGFGIVTNDLNSYRYMGKFANGLPDGLGIQTIGKNIYEG